MPRLGVLGWPVAHSRSPAMHNAALRALGLDDWRYQLLPVPPELLRARRSARSAGAGFVGANVTIPHKQAALALADAASDGGTRDRRRQHADASRPTATIAAENTDAPGLLAALERSSPARDERAWCSAPAAARARSSGRCARPARARSSVWNRTPERAQALARRARRRAPCARPSARRPARQLHLGRAESDGEQLNERLLDPTCSGLETSDQRR